MVEHSTISDPDIHEPKGISTAAVGTAYESNGVGSGTWVKRLPTNGSTEAGKNLASNGTSIVFSNIGAVFACGVVENANTTPVVYSGENVLSVIRNSVGDITINFTVNSSNTKYIGPFIMIQSGTLYNEILETSIAKNVGSVNIKFKRASSGVLADVNSFDFYILRTLT